MTRTLTALAALCLALTPTPAHADDQNTLTVLGASPWIKDGGTFEVRSWGGNWDADKVAHLAVEHRVTGRVDHCDSKCVTTIDAAPAQFCIEEGASINVHLERQFAGAWRGGRYELEHPLRVVSTGEPRLRPELRAWVSAQGGYKPVTFDQYGAPTDYITVPYQVAVRFWRACAP